MKINEIELNEAFEVFAGCSAVILGIIIIVFVLILFLLIAINVFMLVFLEFNLLKMIICFICKKSLPLIVRWEGVWENSIESRMDRNEIFMNYYKEQYNKSYKKKIANKHKNFILKYLFVLLLTLGLMQCVYIIYYDNASIGTLLIALTLGCGIIVKILDIKKYQETWVRHTGTVYKLDREMLMYILEMEPYDSIYREDEFINRVFAIWGDNQNKFRGNMKQENNMMDIFKFTNKKSSE